jgi:probable F420-dependent oxidoreductase
MSARNAMQQQRRSGRVSAVDLGAVRRRLGRVGVWASALGALPAEAERDRARAIEQLGFRTLWVNETRKEAFAHAGLVLSATQHVTVATGIANVWRRDPVSMVLGANTLGEAYPGRFVLGLGIGHARYDAAYRAPLATMRDYLQQMAAAPYEGPEPASPVPWLLAALRPAMVELAGEYAEGVHPYLMPPEHTAIVRAALGPEPVVAPELTVVLDDDATTARATARSFLAGYLGLENYVRSWRALGFVENDLAQGGSDRLVDALVAWGDVEAVRRRVEEHLSAGADHVALQPLAEDGRLPMGALTELGAALLS